MKYMDEDIIQYYLSFVNILILIFNLYTKENGNFIHLSNNVG